MDLAGLLARLNGSAGAQNAAAGSGAQNGSHYEPPSVSSPIASPTAPNQEPRQPQDIISATTSHVQTPINETTGNPTLGSGSDLLGLLRSRQASYQSTATQQRQMPSPQVASQTTQANRPVSAADLVAGFARKSSSIGSITSPTMATPAASRPDLRGEATSSSTNPQDFLLKLLHQSKPEGTISSPATGGNKVAEQQAAAAPLVSPSANAFASQYLQQAILPGFVRASDAHAPVNEKVEQTVQNSTVDSVRTEVATAAAPVFGHTSASVASFGPLASEQKGNVFTYTNPFEELSRASPAAQAQSDAKHVPHVKHPRETSSTMTSIPLAKARKVISTDTPSSPVRVTNSRETVAEAVDEVGEQVDKQVEEALAKLDIQARPPAAKEESTAPGKVIESEKSSDSLVAADWEDEADDKEQRIAKVFVMPMRPFVSIIVDTFEDTPAVVHDSSILTIARMRKAFDQLDRTLVACTSRFIAYTLKSAGLRLIRQDSGKFKQLWADSNERLFNLSIARSRNAAAPGGEKREIETVLGTGYKGTVFWSPLTSMTGGSNTPKPGMPTSEEDQGFSFPAVPAADEQTSSGQLKTRVKPSTRSPEFFAYGRGQNIHIVYPLLARTKNYTDAKTRICDSEKYLRDDDLKIMTGKAAKDFAFSSDDTVIASLDKAGRLKFWDIRSLTKPEFKAELRAGVVAEVRTPIMTLNTTLPAGKSWPTSVMFVDREKPMTRGYALRYMIIGLKQNHTIQLWDLALSKPVQEINFPHNDESDAICSLAFNPRGNMLAVGHPTRNSIYMLNLSLPVYSQTPMNQAKYMSMIAEKNKNLPAVNSTVIFTSIREYSLGSRGQLRSLDLMIDTPVPDEQATASPESIMTLICMHSDAIFEFGLTRKLLGWSPEGKPINQIDALEAKAVSLQELRQPVQEEGSVNGDSYAPSVASTKESPSKSGALAVATVSATPAVVNEHRLFSAATNAAAATPKRDHESDKIKLVATTEKDKKKKKKAENKEAKTASGNTPTIAQDKINKEVLRSSQETEGESDLVSTPRKTQSQRTVIMPREESDATTEAMKQLENTLTAELTKSLNDSFSILYKRLAEDKRAADAAGSAKQDTLLRLFSQTMRENFEGHVTTTIVDAVNKAQTDFKESINSTVDRSVTSTMSNAIKGTLQREIEKSVEQSLSRAFREGNFVRGLGDALSKYSGDLLSKVVANSFAELAPVINSNVINALRQSTADQEHRIVEQLRRYDLRHSQDLEKIDRLTAQVMALTTSLQSVTSEQRSFQNEMRSALSQRSQQAAPPTSRPGLHAGEPSAAAGNVAGTPQQPLAQKRASPAPTPEDTKELQIISNHFEQGRYDEGFVQWLHSDRQGPLFNQFFIHIGPQYLDRATPLVVLSVTAAVSFAIETNMPERLAWITYALDKLDPSNVEYQGVLPRIMDVIVHRIDSALANMGQQQHGSAGATLYAQATMTKQYALAMKDEVAGR